MRRFKFKWADKLKLGTRSCDLRICCLDMKASKWIATILLWASQDPTINKVDKIKQQLNMAKSVLERFLEHIVYSIAFKRIFYPYSIE